MPDMPDAVRKDEIDIFDFVRTLWARRWLVLAITSVFTLGAIAYALLATPWYRAEVDMVPADSKAIPSGLAQLGGLASLAGINVSTGGNSEEPIAVFKSREFARDFIEDKHLLPVLFADKWDSRAGRWKDPDLSDQPDVEDAVELFDKNVRSVAEDKKSGLVTLSVTWTDPTVAAEWANIMVARLNDRMRSQALAEAERNINYLQGEMAATNVTSLQQSIGKVLESEMQKLLLARGSEEFSFKVVDRAVPPKKHVRPKRVLIVFFSFWFGLMLAAAFVVMRKQYVEKAMRT